MRTNTSGSCDDPQDVILRPAAPDPRPQRRPQAEGSILRPRQQVSEARLGGRRIGRRRAGRRWVGNRRVGNPPLERHEVRLRGRRFGPGV